MDTITLKIEKRPDGFYMLTSEDVPGLVLAQSDWNRLFLDAPEAIRDLLKHNCKIDW